MDKINHACKLKVATLEDFVWINAQGDKKIKMGFPFWRKGKDGLSEDWTRFMPDAKENKQYKLNLIDEIKTGKIYVFDKIHRGEK